MPGWLRTLLLTFYSPVRGMSEARDNASLLPSLVLAFLAQAVYFYLTELQFLHASLGIRKLLLLVVSAKTSFTSVMYLALILVPVTILIANLFDRRGSHSVVIRQEFAALTSAVMYAWTAAHLLAIPFSYVASSSGMVASYIAISLDVAKQLQDNLSPELLALLNDPREHARNFYWFLMLPFFLLWFLVAAHAVFRISWLRAIALMVVTTIAVYISLFLLLPIFTWVFASPFLLLLLFFFLRGYLSDVTRSHRARVAFKQNLEAATLNPADASAHYNLGLIHQQRNELDEARKRFERAVEIDSDEIDSHYQLGRIARQQKRYADAISNFEPVVANDPTHAQHEVWREIGSTYFEAGQYEDALNALQRFLDNRESDPEGLYLLGRVHAAMGETTKADASMKACIEAVKSAPAYKYRTEKRWLNEAQDFLRSRA